MSYAKVKEKFPCGYEYEFEIKTTFLDNFSIEGEPAKECPIHGKECPKQSSPHYSNKKRANKPQNRGSK